MTRTLKLTLAAAGAVALVLAAAYSAMERSTRARVERLNWRDITSLTVTRGRAAAADAVDEKLRAHPDNALLHYYRARLYYEEGDSRKALASADRAIGLGYAQEISHLLKAMIHGRQLGDWKKQRDLALKAKVYDPTYPDVYLVLAEAEYHLGEYRACAAAAASFSGLSPKDPEGYQLGQLCFEELKDYGAAEKAAEKLLKLDPADHAALWRQGRMRAARGMHREAVLKFSEAIRLSGGRRSYYTDRAASCAALGDRSCEAWDLASAGEWSESRKYATYYHLLGSAMYRAGELERALKAAARAIELDPRGADSFELRGRLKAETGDVPGAAADLAAACALDRSRKERLAPLRGKLASASKEAR